MIKVFFIIYHMRRWEKNKKMSLPEVPISHLQNTPWLHPPHIQDKFLCTMRALEQYKKPNAHYWGGGGWEGEVQKIKQDIKRFSTICYTRMFGRNLKCAHSAEGTTKHQTVEGETANILSVKVSKWDNLINMKFFERNFLNIECI